MNRTWIELDREALAHNIRRYQSLLPAGCRIMGVVKADAYGHGARAVAAQLWELGIRHFATATLDEAVQLREAGIRTQIHGEQKKFKQKISYADKLSIPYVIFLGEDEINAGVVACKDMKSGEQTKLNTQETIDRIKAGLAELEKGSVIVE